MNFLFQLDKSALERFCTVNHIRRLSLFGSEADRDINTSKRP